MTMRIARCEAALLEAVKAMEAMMDGSLHNSLSLTEEEEHEVNTSSSDHRNSMGTSSVAVGAISSQVKQEPLGSFEANDASTNGSQHVLPSYLFRALLKHKAGKRARVADSDDAPRNDENDVVVLRDNSNGHTTKPSSNVFSSLLVLSDVAPIVENSSPVTRSLSHAIVGGSSGRNGNASRQSVSDVDRQKLVSSVESKLNIVRGLANAIHASFDHLASCVDSLPDVPADRVERDLGALVAENAALRDEVVGLYDQSVALYERCLHIPPQE